MKAYEITVEVTGIVEYEDPRTSCRGSWLDVKSERVARTATLDVRAESEEMARQMAEEYEFDDEFASIESIHTLSIDCYDEASNDAVGVVEARTR